MNHAPGAQAPAQQNPKIMYYNKNHGPLDRPEWYTLSCLASKIRRGEAESCDYINYHRLQQRAALYH